MRPHLEYAVQIWNPYLEGDIEKIEKVQERDTKIQYGFSELCYEKRLRINLRGETETNETDKT